MSQTKQPKSIIYFILILFLSIKLFHLLTQKGISWDGSVYLEMGKYIFSAGKVGLWESSRPLIWPILLGALWKISLNPIIFGRLLQLIFSIGCICLTYLIAKNIFDEKTALISSFLLAFSPTFLFYSSTLLTGIPSTFFALVSVHFFIKQDYLKTGLFIGLSCMTRFLQLFIIIPLLTIILIKEKKKIKSIKGLAYGILIITIPYLTLNLILYKNPLYPFLLQSFMSKYTGWIFNQPLNFYFLSLFKENFIVLLTLIGIPLIIIKPNKKKITLLSIFLLFFIFFSSIAHKETRFMVAFLPYLYIITAASIFACIKPLKKKKILLYSIIFLITVAWLIREIPQITAPSFKEYPEFQNYLNNKETSGNIWISSPIFIANSDKKAEEPIYYPLYNTKKIAQLKTRINQADHILLNTCDILPCPKTDKECEKETTIWINSIKEELKTVYSQKEKECEYFIFQKAIS
ncbi:MAG: glycosyltransferase family 39 protein [Nanoarchaeota archaeon]|nr:glycosyltransferase family 39 protein [Nanoarchaeota archaeon]